MHAWWEQGTLAQAQRWSNVQGNTQVGNGMSPFISSGGDMILMAGMFTTSVKVDQMSMVNPSACRAQTTQRTCALCGVSMQPSTGTLPQHSDSPKLLESDPLIASNQLDPGVMALSMKREAHKAGSGSSAWCDHGTPVTTH